MLRRLQLLLVTVVVAVAAPAAAQGATYWWGSAVPAPGQVRVTTCPTTALCVAGEEGGQVLTTTSPRTGPWQSTAIPGADEINGIACPAATECLAVDQAGHLLTSTDPTGGPSAWTVSMLSTRALTGIACPSTTLCAATVDYGAISSEQDEEQAGMVLVSTHPLDPGSWVPEHADSDISDGGVCGKNGPWDGCGNDLTGISCPSAGLCAAEDDNGAVFTSDDPAAGSGATWALSIAGTQSDLTHGFDCVSDHRCLALCAVALPSSIQCPGDSNGDDYAVGYVVEWDPSVPPLDHNAPTSGPIRPDVDGLWCGADRTCFIAAGGRGLLSSSTGNHWTPTLRSEPQAVGCARGLCVGFTYTGRAFTGIAPSTASLKAWLRTVITPADAATLRRRGRYTARLAAPVPASTTITWSSGRVRIARRGASKALTIVLTAAGRRRLREHPATPLRASATLTGSAGQTVTVSRTFGR